MDSLNDGIQASDIAGLQRQIEQFWTVLDDISTAGDMAKNNDRQYRSFVQQILARGLTPIKGYYGCNVHTAIPPGFGKPLNQITDVQVLKTMQEALSAIIEDIRKHQDLDDVAYRQAVDAMCEKRSTVLISDGYNLFLNPKSP